MVLFTSFAEHEVLGRPQAADLAGERPLACFAGIWTRWTGVRKLKKGQTTNDVFAFLTTEPSEPVRTYHPKAVLVILTTQEEIEMWMTASTPDAMRL